MAARTAHHDWAATPLRSIESWPQSLKTLVSVMLGSKQAMFIAWGEQRTLLYNDAYAAVLADKHPVALGKDFLAVWAEIRGDLVPIVEQAYAGEPVHMDDITLVMHRRGYPEETHFAFSYTPVRGDDGQIAGFFCPCNEITGQVLAERQLRQSEERLRLVFDGARDYAILTLDMERHVTSWSAGAEAAFGYAAMDVIGRSGDILFTPEDRQAGQPIIESEIARREGMAPDVRWHRRRDGGGVFLNGAMRPLHDGAGRQIGYLKIARDETERRRADDALREVEERYRLAARATNDAIWDWRMADDHVVWNAALQTLFGHAERATDAKWWIEHIHPDDRQRVSDGIHAVIDGDGTNWSAEYRFRRADGSHAHLFDRGTVLRDDDGRAVRMIGAMLDLTEQRSLGDRLRESEARYRMLFETIESGFCVVEVRFDAGDDRVDYRVIEANPAFHKQTGFAEDVLGRWLREAAPALEESWYEIYGRVARTGAPERFEQGSASLGRWFDVYAFRIGNPDDRRVAILFNDISARRSAEERLRALNENLEAQVAERTADRERMWRLSADIMLVARFDGTITAVNPAWTALFGWSEHELIGRSFLELVHPDDTGSTAVAAGDLSHGTTISQFENRYRAKDGSYRFLSWAAVPGADLIHAVGRDITADRERDAELEQAQEQLRQAQKMEAVGQLTGGIAHDFNNLLTGVIGSLDMMQRQFAKGDLSKMERYTTTAITSANRAAALTHRLLAFSRRQPLDPKPVNANRLVTGMEELLRRTIGETVRLEIVTAGGLWQTLCDPHQLESAILNLAINARDAMPEGGAVTIETCNAHLDNAYAARQREVTPGQYVCICVTDTGTGMSEDTIAKAFEPFFTTKPIGQGTGLGLSMIYGFARQSEGYAKIYSEVGKGTTFKLYLPRHYGEGEEEESHSPELGDELRAERGEVVLVVEDETAVRGLVTDVLEELGYRALEAVDGPSGLKILQSKQRIDLLVTDIGLPGLNGRQLADAARERRPDLRVLFMTGYAENATIANGFLDPGMSMITKPFAIDALATRIRGMIEAD